MLEKLEVKEWLSLNAKLQVKKNAIRKALKEMGVLKREGENKFDRYKYYSESQYKTLFTQLLADNGLELKFTELEYGLFDGSEKQGNGRMPKVEFSLIDIDTGFYETTAITGEGIDKGDKAGYKAYTGALKYFLADTFMVATGDDPETESPEVGMNKSNEKKATPNQIQTILSVYRDENLTKLLAANKIAKIEDLPMQTASNIISKLGGKK